MGKSSSQGEIDVTAQIRMIGGNRELLHVGAAQPIEDSRPLAATRRLLDTEAVQCQADHPSDARTRIAISSAAGTASEKEPPGTGVFVDGASCRPDHLGDFLAFVEEHGLSNRPECGIGAKARRCRLGSHIDSHKVSSQPRRRGGLPCSTRANDQQRRQLGEQVCQRAINKMQKVGCDQHSPGPLALSPTVD